MALKLSVSASLRLILLAFTLTACSIPNLEKPECMEPRETVKQFFSFHFGNDMKPSVENLKQREKFLTKELISSLSASPITATDYFTMTDNYPVAFRVGRCEVVSPEKTIFEVLLFWRDDTKNEQRAIKVETVKEGGKWLINNVVSK